MTSVLLDANIILELFFNRPRYDKVVEVIGGLEAELCVSVLTVDLLMYFVEARKADPYLAGQFISNYRVLDMTSQDVEWAMHHHHGDFEDALQIACALRHHCQQVVTLDTKLNQNFAQDITIKLIR